MTASPAPLDANRLASASGWRMAFLLVQGGGSVILSAALSHILDARAFAITSLAQGVLVIAQTIGDFGLSQAAVTVLPARIAASPAAAARLLGGAANAYFYAGAAAFLLTLASVGLVPQAALVPIVVSAPAAAAMVLLAGADGLLRSQGEFRRPVAFVVASELGGFIGIPVALGTHSPAWTCAAVSAGTTLGAAGAVLTLREHAGDARAARGFLRAATPLGLTQAFVVLCTRFDTLLAASLTGLVAAGTFEGDWRIYQLGQYAAGALATAAAPFIANRLGANQLTQAFALLGRLLLRLLGVGLAAGALLYFARWPLAHLLAGSLSVPVAHGLVFLAAVSPIAAVAIPAYYTLIALDGERLPVLGCFIVGAAVNLGLGPALAGALHVHGFLIGCAAGTTVTSVMLLTRLALVISGLRRQPAAAPEQRSVGKIG
jgi:O-antigen/teichoic acid export membrane protein